MPVAGGVEANLERHLALARRAAAAGADLLVYPELSLTGYEIERAPALAFAPDDPRLAPLAEVARAHELRLVVGAPVRAGGRLHIGAFILSPGGIALYTKQRMGAFGAAAAVDGAVPPAEATVFAPGTLDPLVRRGDMVAAVAVCADVGLATHAPRAAERGADAYLASMFVIPSEFEGERRRLGVIAARHTMAIAFANYGGPTGGLASAGRSAILSEGGDCVVELPRSGEGVAVARRADGRWSGEALPG